MRYISYAIVAAIGFCLSGCGDSQRAKFDKGYEAAWDGEELSTSFWTNKEEKAGYEAGLDDVWTYDTGYYDGYEGKRPEYFKDRLYMDAYKDGKKDKERGR